MPTPGVRINFTYFLRHLVQCTPTLRYTTTHARESQEQKKQLRLKK